MIFDVMLRDGYNADGRPVIKNYQVHESKLDSIVQRAQNEGLYIIKIRKREEVKKPTVRYKLYKKPDPFDGA
jgi:hypothetical protein